MPDGLGEFLRSSRARVRPATDAPQGRRRVPGLRRIEVATTAGVSVDYYTRLEQNREQHPSAQVVEALAAALELDEDARMHLFRLADGAPLEHRPAAERADPGLLALIGAWRLQPAIVLGRAFDVLGQNDANRALLGDFRPSGNLLVGMFTDPATRAPYADWSAAARTVVSSARLVLGRDQRNPALRTVVEDLCRDSPEFAAMWDENVVSSARLPSKRFRPDGFGDLVFDVFTFDVRSPAGQELSVYEPRDEATRDALRRLMEQRAAARAEEREDPRSATEP